MAGSLSQDGTGHGGPRPGWCLAPGVRLRPEPFGGLAFAQRSGRLVVLTPQLYELLAELRDQPPEPDDEGSRSVERHDGDAVGFDDKVEAAMRRLAKSGIVLAPHT